MQYSGYPATPFFPEAGGVYPAPEPPDSVFPMASRIAGDLGGRTETAHGSGYVEMVRIFNRSMGGECVRRRFHRLRRSELAGSVWLSAQRPDEVGGTLPTH